MLGVNNFLDKVRVVKRHLLEAHSPFWINHLGLDDIIYFSLVPFNKQERNLGPWSQFENNTHNCGCVSFFSPVSFFLPVLHSDCWPLLRSVFTSANLKLTFTKPNEEQHKERIKIANLCADKKKMSLVSVGCSAVIILKLFFKSCVK